MPYLKFVRGLKDKPLPAPFSASSYSNDGIKQITRLIKPVLKQANQKNTENVNATTDGHHFGKCIKQMTKPSRESCVEPKSRGFPAFPFKTSAPGHLRDLGIFPSASMIFAIAQ